MLYEPSVFFSPAPEPIAVFCLPNVLFNAANPTAVLSPAVLLSSNAPEPIAVLPSPVVLVYKDWYPVAVL